MRPLAVATCDLDLLIVRGLVPADEPFPFGHECVAEVTEVGDSVDGREARATWSASRSRSPAASATRCRRGQTGNCERVERMAMYGLPMGTQLRRLPRATRSACRSPTRCSSRSPTGSRPSAVASLSDNIPDAWRTVAPQLAERAGLAGPDRGERRRRSPSTRPRSPSRSAPSGWTSSAATRSCDGEPPSWGRTCSTRSSRSGSGPYPITVDASGDPDGLACALRSTEPDGICTSHRHLLRRGDAGAPAGDVHEGDPLPHRPRPRPSGDGAGPRARARGQLRPRAHHRRDRESGTTPPRPSPATAGKLVISRAG